MPGHSSFSGTGYRVFRIFRTSLILSLLTGFAATSSALAAGPITLDGQFADWDGQASVADPQDDALSDKTDIKSFYFATNPDEETVYYLVERWDTSQLAVDYRLRIDTNNNGDYSEAVDRIVDVHYDPAPSGFADVNLYDGVGGFLRTIAGDAPWGETNPGARVEWGVSFSDLGIAPFQTLRMQLISMQGNKVSDEAAEVQWSPADALGRVALTAVVIGGAVWLFTRRKKFG